MILRGGACAHGEGERDFQAHGGSVTLFSYLNSQLQELKEGLVFVVFFFFVIRLHILKIYINQHLAITYNGKESEKEYIYIYIYKKLNHFAIH